jgi:hypothetical protein
VTTAGAKPLTLRELNRALLARQGLLEPIALAVMASSEALRCRRRGRLLWSTP